MRLDQTGRPEGSMSGGGNHWPRGLRARLAWVGRGVGRGPHGAMRIRLVHRGFLSRLHDRIGIVALSVPRLGAEAWPLLLMQLAPGPSGAPLPDGRVEPTGEIRTLRESGPGAKVTTVWKVVERHAGPGPAVQTGRDRDAPALGGRTTRHAPGDARASAPIAARSSLVWRPPGSSPLLTRLVSRPWLVRSVDGSAAPVSERTGHRGQTTPMLLNSISALRREDRPAFAASGSPSRTAAPAVAAEAATAARDVDSPSLVDQLFARGEHATPFAALTLRVLPTQSPAAAAVLAPAEGRAGQSPATSAQPAATSPLHTRFSRGDIDLLVDKVVTLIKRQERLERESRGIL